MRWPACRPAEEGLGGRSGRAVREEGSGRRGAVVDGRAVCEGWAMKRKQRPRRWIVGTLRHPPFPGTACCSEGHSSRYEGGQAGRTRERWAAVVGTAPERAGVSEAPTGVLLVREPPPPASGTDGGPASAGTQGRTRTKDSAPLRGRGGAGVISWVGRDTAGFAGNGRKARQVVGPVGSDARLCTGGEWGPAVSCMDCGQGFRRYRRGGPLGRPSV